MQRGYIRTENKRTKREASWEWTSKGGYHRLISLKKCFNIQTMKVCKAFMSKYIQAMYEAFGIPPCSTLTKYQLLPGLGQDFQTGCTPLLFQNLPQSEKHQGPHWHNSYNLHTRRNTGLVHKNFKDLANSDHILFPIIWENDLPSIHSYVYFVMLTIHVCEN